MGTVPSTDRAVAVDSRLSGVSMAVKVSKECSYFTKNENNNSRTCFSLQANMRVVRVGTVKKSNAPIMEDDKVSQSTCTCAR